MKYSEALPKQIHSTLNSGIFEIKTMAFSNKKFELSPRLKSGVGRGYSQNQILKLAAIICLTLALGLTINTVRLVMQNKNQPATESDQPQVLGASDAKQPESITNVQFITYTIQKGDTLFDISQKFSISWTTLASLNNLKSPFYLKPGQTLKIPKQ